MTTAALTNLTVTIYRTEFEFEVSVDYSPPDLSGPEETTWEPGMVGEAELAWSPHPLTGAELAELPYQAMEAFLDQQDAAQSEHDALSEDA